MKKMLVVMLLCALTLGLFSGCAATGNAPAATDEEPQTTAAQTEAADSEKMQFTTTDLDGATVTLSDFADAKLILVNFWEPWCGPCVGELPDLARLYDTYRDRGLVILGVFQDMEDSAKELAESRLRTLPPQVPGSTWCPIVMPSIVT